MNKQERHLKIRELLSQKVISRQEELMMELQKEGFKVTQATLSRDLWELGVARVPYELGFRYVLSSSGSREHLRQMVPLEITSIQSNETLIVIKTLPGHAQAVGLFLDQLEMPEILGTVAGDDTVLVVPVSVKRTAEVVDQIRHALETPTAESQPSEV